MTDTDDPVAASIEAACVPLDSGHGCGTLDRAQSILAEHPIRFPSGYREVDELLGSYLKLNIWS